MGGIVNSVICIATVIGIVEGRASYILEECGGSLALERRWAKFFLQRVGFVTCKATRAARELPKDFDKNESRLFRRDHADDA